MPDEIKLRPARINDARHIAVLIAEASDGVALIDWSDALAERPGAELIDVGAGAYRSEEGDYSYRNCTMAEHDGAVVGTLLTFPMGRREPPAAPPPFAADDVYAPYRYLEAPDTWYVCGVAVYPGFRGRGVGGRFMALAERQARERGYDRVSLVAFEANAGAVRLYRRLGYAETARAPIVPHPLIRCDGDALLMVKSL